MTKCSTFVLKSCHSSHATSTSSLVHSHFNFRKTSHFSRPFQFLLKSSSSSSSSTYMISLFTIDTLNLTFRNFLRIGAREKKVARSMTRARISSLKVICNSRKSLSWNSIRCKSSEDLTEFTARGDDLVVDSFN
jgi:hypothetical protein